MATPHINAKDGAFAVPIALMPGDPARQDLRRWKLSWRSDQRICDIAQHVQLYQYLQSRRISVMGHGMGIPVLLIYAKG